MYSKMLLFALLFLSSTSFASKPVFSGQRAMELIEYQCSLGSRTIGSEASIALQDSVKSLCSSLKVKFTPQCFSIDDPYSDEKLQLTNMIISLGPDKGKRLWLAAHYDSRPVCDKDPDPKLRDIPLVGANDGASGVAVLMHLIELLASAELSNGVDIILFDGEDYGHSGDIDGFCIGSKYLAEHWKDFGSPLSHSDPIGMILIDMVGESNLQIPMEYYSLSLAPEWTLSIFDRADKLGLTAFVPIKGKPAYDDHVPFLEIGVPAVDLIDFDFPQWHTSADTPDVCSPESLQQVGELLLDICLNPLF